MSTWTGGNDVFYTFDFPGSSDRDCCIHQGTEDQEIQVSELINFSALYCVLTLDAKHQQTLSKAGSHSW